MTADEFRSILDYDPMTGQFSWRIKIGRIKPGDPAVNRFSSPVAQQ